ncbi:MAG: hypothetical protein ACI89X_002155 [Planctomycetota bacterium]|jgi:hypothetical protein
MQRPQQSETSLGPPLVRENSVWCIDLESLPILHGLSVISRALSEMVLAQARADRVDVTVERKLRAGETPELIEVFGIEVVKVSSEVGSIQNFIDSPEVLETRLRALLGSLQRQPYRDAVMPQDGSDPRALVAQFDTECEGKSALGSSKQRYVLERLATRHDKGRGGLRITIEDLSKPRLNLDAVPHLVIDDVAERQFIAGSTRIAQSWTESLRREAVRGRRSFFEHRDPHSHLFRQLDQAGLGSLQRVSVQWSEHVLPFLLENEPTVPQELLKRVLLALEDRGLRDLLAEREVVRVDAGAVPVYLDIAQLGRVLELSLGQRRQRDDADAFLARMPALSRIIEQNGTDLPLKSTPVFLVHHMTGEIVGLIAALRALGCRDLTVLFVSYASEPPASYLDAVLDQPADEFRALALVNVPQRGSVEGVYHLSHQYSKLDESDEIERAIATAQHFLEAMRAAGVVPFLRQVARAEAKGQRCLLVEDGGYLAPVLHDALLRDLTVKQFAGELGHEVGDERSLQDAVGSRVLGTVEHTRNGFDRLVSVQERHGRLPLPAYSIAISQLKREVESREVAASVLNAIEAVLNADGRVLARRSCLVLGSRGAIGRELCRSLQPRIDNPAHNLAGIDRVVTELGETQGLTEASALAGLPSGRWLDVDLVIGVIGRSLLTGNEVEDWLLNSSKSALVLVSGSTKKVEFGAIMKWFDGLLHQDVPTLAGEPVRIKVEELLDPRTARVYGHRWIFSFAHDRTPRTVISLANMTPINFLFYGVATEIIDEVLAQLLSVTLAAVKRADDPAAIGCMLAVDHQIDEHGNPLPE